MSEPDRNALLRAHRIARLRGSLDEALENPALAIGLRNLAGVIARRLSTHPEPPHVDIKARSAGERPDQE